MVVGYSLGNRNDPDNDIQVLGEDDDNVLTYTRSLNVVLTRMCRNECPYCSFQKKDNLAVPYSTIRRAKDARATGAREALVAAGERPDRFAHIRSVLDLWGFESYLDYMYTVCELGFLEGLIPVLEVGFLSPPELKRLQEICALVKVMLDSTDANNYQKLHPKSPGKKMSIRLKVLEWAGKLSFPAVTGIMVGIGENKTHRKDALNEIAGVHQTYGNVHEVLIQNFVTQKGTKFEKHSSTDEKLLLETVELARNILPDDVPVTVPIEYVSNIENFIKAGVRDLGRITEGTPLFGGGHSVDMDELEAIAEKMGFRLQQRFPLRKPFIKEGKYSKKLGQVFDTYRYRIKKETQERVKEAKLSGNGN